MLAEDAPRLFVFGERKAAKLSLKAGDDNQVLHVTYRVIEAKTGRVAGAGGLVCQDDPAAAAIAAPPAGGMAHYQPLLLDADEEQD